MKKKSALNTMQLLMNLSTTSTNLMDSQDKVFHALPSLPMMLTDKLLALTQELRQFGPFPSGD